MDSAPGFTAIQETEEAQIWASGPDNNHQRFQMKVTIDSTVTDSGNTPTSTLRGGLVMGLKDSDGNAYAYDADANDGTQKIIGVLEKHVNMLDRFGTAEDKFSKILNSGIIKLAADLVGEDKFAIAVLARLGFRFPQVDPHGSLFGFYPKARYFKAADYTLLDADHGCRFVATAAVNFTLPSLATVGPGYWVHLYNAANTDMVITGAANTILIGDAGGAPSTTITFNTANEKMGGQALMYSDYADAAGSLAWYVLFTARTYTTA